MDTSSLRLGRYRADALLGVGGMAEVWSARELPGVALKVLSEEAAGVPQLVRAVRTEVRIAAELYHPGIIRILDTGTVAAGALEIPWIAMERAEQSLADGLDEAVDLRDVLGQVLSALAHAHARGVLHRDVKPGNVLRLGDRWVLSDFGLAASATTGRLHGGSPGYAAPEQLQGASQREGPWTDIYAVGAMAWALCTGRAPREASDLQSGEVPAVLAEWIGRATAYRPEQRFRHAADARAALPEDWSAATPIAMAEQTSSESSTQYFLDDAPVRVLPGVGPSAPQVAHAPLPEAPPVDAVPGPGARALAMLVPQPLPAQEAVRAAVWAGLRRAEAGERGVVVVRGGPGSGRHTLVRRLLAAASESGAVAAVQVRASPGRPIGMHDLAREALDPHGGSDPDELAALWGIDDPALAELLDPSLPVIRLHTPAMRVEAMERALSAWAGPRTLVVAIEEVEHSVEALLLATEHLERLPARTLLLLTLASDRPQAVARDLLDQLPAPVEMAPVPGPDGSRLPWRDAVDRRLGLEEPRKRLVRLPDSCRRALEVAAVLGRDVDQDLWVEVCAAVGLADPRDQLPVLFQEGWLEPEGRRRWLFRSQALHRSVLDAVHPGRVSAIHRAAAEALKPRGPSRALAEHLLALDERVVAARVWYSNSSERADLSILTLAELERRMHVDPPDRALVLVWVMRAHRQSMSGDFEGSEEHLRRVEAFAEERADPVALALLRFGRAWNCLRIDEDGSRRVVEAGHLSEPPEEVGPYWERSQIVLLHAELCWTLERKGDAVAATRRALELADREAGRPSHRLNVLLRMAQYQIGFQRLEAARATLDELALGTRDMSGSMLSSFHQLRAFLAELGGDIEQAAAETGRSVEIRDAMQLPAPFGRVNHAVYLAQLGRLDEAEARLAEQSDPPGVAHYLWTTRLAIAAGRSDLVAVRALLDAPEEPTDDLAALLEQVAEQLAPIDGELAARARRVADEARSHG